MSTSQARNFILCNKSLPRVNPPRTEAGRARTKPLTVPCRKRYTCPHLVHSFREEGGTALVVADGGGLVIFPSGHQAVIIMRLAKERTLLHVGWDFSVQANWAGTEGLNDH